MIDPRAASCEHALPDHGRSRFVYKDLTYSQPQQVSRGCGLSSGCPRNHTLVQQRLHRGHDKNLTHDRSQVFSAFVQNRLDIGRKASCVVCSGIG